MPRTSEGKNNPQKLSADFCTCPDHSCAFNPVNHDKGCSLCVAKCIGANEIPTCFFKKAEPRMSREQDYSFNGFANFVLYPEKRKLKEEERR